METCTDFLFARPSFLEGVARIMDVGDTLNEYNSSPSAQEADAIAISLDWSMVGQDIDRAIDAYESQSEA